MRPLGEIVRLAKEGQKPTYDECYYAMLALSALWSMDHQTITAIARAPHKTRVELLTQEVTRRNAAALDKPPKEWLGWENDPANPEYQLERRVFNAIFEQLVALK